MGKTVLILCSSPQSFPLGQGLVALDPEQNLRSLRRAGSIHMILVECGLWAWVISPC